MAIITKTHREYFFVYVKENKSVLLNSLFDDESEAVDHLLWWVEMHGGSMEGYQVQKFVMY